MKKNVIRLLMSLVALLTMGNVAFAENKLWIASDGVSDKFAIMMDCDESAAALQFNLRLPEGLELVPQMVEGSKQYVYRDPERFNNGQALKCVERSADNYFVMVVSMNQEPFRGNSSIPLAYFNVKKTSETGTWNQADLKLTDIIMSTGNGTQLPADATSVYNGAMYGELKAYFGVKSIDINPEETKVKIPIALSNSFPVSGLQMDITLPKGFSLVTQGKAIEAEHTSRVNTNAQISYVLNEATNTYGLVMVNIFDNKVIDAAGDGDIFYLYVNAPSSEVYNNNVQFSISRVIASAYPGQQTVHGSGATLNVENGWIAYNNFNTEIEGLETQLTQTLEQIATECPYVKDNYTGDAITSAIEALKASVKEKYEAKNLDADDADVKASIAEIKTSIETLLSNAQKAQAEEVKRREDNEAAYNAAVASLKTIQEQYNSTVELLKTDYEGYYDEQEVTDLGQEIEGDFATLKDAYDKVETEGTFKNPINEAELTSKIETLLTDAANKKNAADVEDNRKAENEKKYKEILAQIQDLQDQLDAAKAEAEAKYPGFTPETEINNAQAMINAETAEADKLYGDVANEGVYEDSVATDAIKDAIALILPAAAALAEGDRVAQNAAAYKADLDAVKTLEANLRTVKAQLLADYKNVDMSAETLAVENAIKDAKDKADAENERVATEGVYESQVNVEGLQAQIDNLLVEAQKKADQAAAEAAEEQRRAENLKAYNAAKAEVAALQAALDKAAEDVKAYPVYDSTADVAAIQGMIDALGQKVEDNYAAVATEGNFENPVTAADKTAVDTAISDMLAAAKKAQDDASAAEAEAARKEANQAAYNAALLQIAEIQNHFEATVTTIAENYADYADAAAQNAVQGQITAAKTAAEAELARVANEGNFNYTVPADALNAAIDKLLADAKAAADKAVADAETARKENNKAAYDADMNKIAELNADYLAVLSEIAENYADFRNAAAENTVKLRIDAAEKAVEKAYAAVANEGTYATPSEFNYEELKAAINKLLTDAQQAKADKEAADAAAEEKRKADNKAAYEAALAEIQAVQEYFDGIVAEIQKDYAEYEDVTAEAAVQAQINDAKKAADAAYAAVAEEGKFIYSVPSETLKAAADALLAAAKALKAAADDKAEQDRLAANKAAYEAALADVKVLQTALDNMIDKVAATYPDFVDADANAAVQAMIDAIQAAIVKEYNDTMTEGNFDYTVDGTTVNAAIQALFDNAKAAADKAAADAEAARQAANKAAYDAALAEIAEIENYYNQTVDAIAEKLAEYADADAEAAVKAQIEAAKAAAEAAYKAVATEGTFDYTVPAEALNAAIAKLLADAQAAADKAAAEAAAEAERKAQNEAAYNAALAQLKAVQDHFNGVVAEIQANYAEYEDKDAENTVQAEIENVKAAIEAAYAAVANEGKFSYDVPVDSLNDSIDALLANAKAAADKAAAEAAEAERKAQNEAAYNAALAQLQEAQDYFNAIVDEIKANYAEYEDVDAENAVQAEIDNVKSAIEAAYAAVANEGKFEYTVPVDALKADADALLAAAKKAADEAVENDRKAKNEAAYNDALAQLQEVQDYLDEVVEKIKAEYPDFDVDTEAAAVQAEIDNVKEAIEVAYELVANEGTFSYKVPVASLKASVDGLLEKAVASGVDGIEADEAETYYFTTDGKRHANPVHGEINIVVRKNGQTSKMYVK